MKSAHFFGHFIFLVYFCTTQQGNCCCSSVVEHFLGKEEVTSSSLVNSSIYEEAVLSGRMAPFRVSGPASGEGPPLGRTKTRIEPRTTLRSASESAPFNFGTDPVPNGCNPSKTVVFAQLNKSHAFCLQFVSVFRSDTV